MMASWQCDCTEIVQCLIIRPVSLFIVIAKQSKINQPTVCCRLIGIFEVTGSSQRTRKNLFYGRKSCDSLTRTVTVPIDRLRVSRHR